jgi:hypothetical protein
MIKILDEKSKICYDGHYRPWIKIKCTQCKKIVWKEKRWIKSDKAFCSKNCQSLNRQKRVEVNCLFCNNKILKIPAHIKINKTGTFFCDIKCRNLYINKYRNLFQGTKVIQCCKCGDNVIVDKRASKIKCDKCRHPIGKKNKTDYYKVIKGEEATTSYTALRQFLLKKGIKENKCEICGITEWQGRPICIQLHHKDGNRKNNLLKNLGMACPNCHSQTETWGRNKNRKKDTLDVAQLAEP